MAFARRTDVKQRQHRRENLVQVPSSLDDCTNLFMQCLNETNNEKKQQQELLLQFIDQAAEKNRHPFQAFVMLIGASGDGKSSTINHLMNAKMIATSDRASETRSVTEYSRACNVPELGLKGLKMSIVDTPGFGDTFGHEQDACNLWAMRKFCNKYLNTAKILAYPNIILLCINATQKRFHGPKSTFVKNLEILEAMRIIDKRNANIVLVLTSACSVPCKKWTEKISEIAKNMNETLKSKLGFHARVAYIENEFEDNDLEVSGHGTLLPDGTRQPDNLYLTIMEQLRENGDQLGHSTFRQIYDDGIMKQQFLRGNSVPAKDMSKEDSRMDKDEKLCFLILQDVSGAYEGLNELRAEFERLHEENMKSKKCQAEHDQIVKNMASKIEQVVEDNARLNREQETSRRREERLEERWERREKQFEDEMRQKEESIERDRRDMAEQVRREREQAEEKKQQYEDQVEQMKKRNEHNQKEVEEIKDQMRKMKLQSVPIQQPALICTDNSRQQTTKKTNWFKRKGKSFTEIAKNLVVSGLMKVANVVVPHLAPRLQAITAGK